MALFCHPAFLITQLRQNESHTTIINTAASTGVIDGVHMVSNGSPGHIQLGNEAITNKTIERSESEWTQWREALGPEACILVDASQVAGDDGGKELVDRLGEITGATITASEDDTGALHIYGMI